MARIELARLSDIRKNTNFIIAPYDAVNKERADLVLTGVPADDLSAINNAIEALHTARASTAVAIRIDFLGGNIDVGTKTDGSAIAIPVGYDNIHLYGNGVKIMGEVQDILGADAYSVLDSRGNNCILDGFDIGNSSGDGVGLYNTGTNCTITGNTCSGDSVGLYNYGANCTITGNTCSSSGGYGTGLNNTGTDCTIIGNTCSGDYGYGLSNYGTDCTITGNICSGSYGTGLNNSGNNCTITGNTCSGSGDGTGLNNTGTDCTITGNTCSSGGDGAGLDNYGTDCTITGNTCSSGGYGLFCNTSDTVNKCIIIGNVCKTGGISVKTGTCLPATQAVMADVNTGVVTLRP